MGASGDSWLHEELLARPFLSEDRTIISEGVWWTLIMAASVVANSVAVASLIYSEEIKIFHRHFLLSLFVTNLLTSISTMSLLALDCYFRLEGAALFAIYKIMWTASFSINKGFLILLQYDRYLKIKRRHAYASYMTDVRVRYLRCAPLAVAVGITGLSLLFFQVMLQLVSCGTLLIMISLVLLSTRTRCSLPWNRKVVDCSRPTPDNNGNSNQCIDERTKTLLYLSHAILLETVLLLSPGLLTSLVLYFPQCKLVTPLVTANRYLTRFPLFGILLDPCIYIWITFTMQHRLVTAANVQDHKVRRSIDDMPQESVAFDAYVLQQESSGPLDVETVVGSDLQVVWETRVLSPQLQPTPTRRNTVNDAGKSSCVGTAIKIEEWPEQIKVGSAHRPSVCFVRALDILTETTETDPGE